MVMDGDGLYRKHFFLRKPWVQGFAAKSPMKYSHDLCVPHLSRKMVLNNQHRTSIPDVDPTRLAIFTINRQLSSEDFEQSGAF